MRGEVDELDALLHLTGRPRPNAATESKGTG
jgi:hypothetical protein